MQFRIMNNDSRIPYGRLSEAAVNEAAERLSGEAFKAWVKLAIAKNGSIKTVDIDYDIQDELQPYIFFGKDNTPIFMLLDGEETSTNNAQAKLKAPPVWDSICSLYSFIPSDYSQIDAKLTEYKLSDLAEEIMNFWKEHIAEVDCSKANKNPVIFGFKIALTIWMKSCFQLQPGDMIDLGVNASNVVRFTDTKIQARIKELAQQSPIKEITERNCAIWNKSLQEGRMEFDPLVVGKILTARKI